MTVFNSRINTNSDTFRKNREEMMEELLSSSILGRGRVTRIGTGEFMDSLALEHLTGFFAGCGTGNRCGDQRT